MLTAEPGRRGGFKFFLFGFDSGPVELVIETYDGNFCFFFFFIDVSEKEQNNNNFDTN